MSFKFEEGKDLIIQGVVDRIKKNMVGKQANCCVEFIKQFYGTVSLEDLRHWDPEDQYGAAVNLWAFIKQRAADQTKIHIYNPEFEQHGWQTTHTVIEIITDDMPFLVDSLKMVINRLGLVSHLIINLGGLRFVRDKNVQITTVLPNKNGTNNPVSTKNVSTEAAIFIEIDRQTDPKILEELHHNIEKTLQENRIVVNDWLPMRAKLREAITKLKEVANVLDPDELAETEAFLNWIEDHHFTLLGIRDYKLVHKNGEVILQPLPDTGLGLLRESISKSNAHSISCLTPEARELTLSSRILIISKTHTESSVHRQAYTDYIGIKQFNKKGEVVSERRIIGLYTSAAYNTNPKHIPFLRHKVASVMKSANVNPKGHAGKVLLNILETLPRDDLIQATEDELLEIAIGIYHLQERRRIRLFARTDIYRRFVSCLVFVPKDRFNTELRQAMEKILAESFNSTQITFSTWFPESILARIHFIVRTDPKDNTQWDFEKIEQKLIAVSRSWTDDLQHFLFEVFGEEQGNRLFARYKNSFSIAYSETYSPRTAVNDIKHIETLSEDHPLGMNFYKLMVEKTESYRLKIYQHNQTIPLSDVLPILERLGMRAISERPYVLRFNDGKETWINDFALVYSRKSLFSIEDAKNLFQNAFTNIWFGQAENDGFNQLVLSAGLDWREVAVLRTYAKYFKQIGFIFSQDYIEIALNNNPLIAKKLVQLFNIRFNLAITEFRETEAKKIIEEIWVDLDEVINLDEDKIIRQYVHTIMATVRTNYYQLTNDNKIKNYISLKLNSREIPGIPKPYPMFEIFIYSPKFEGVHLRSGKVARGGIRWSERREDFRTEILGLMKAQQVKNAVIVPSGAKGGFIPKQLPVNGTREEILTEGIECYKLFIRGLLDITDNYSKGEIVKPLNIICYDEDDPYLVVAADKGTATFSDTANEISFEYNFWLGDAFASGGSIGYDHKKMAITARGAWESVKRHFYELNKNIQDNDFTVIGIGDMAGDVFGNGMLLSKHIRLLAAFNHMHIFIDPNPDAEISFTERERLFNLPRSGWNDYNKDLISQGGGIFNRSAKSIQVSDEMKEVFDIKQSTVEPNELIRFILCARADLLWSGGIGTFVKAKNETQTEVGDRTNDAIRINGEQLRCKVVAEGGNLGLTQMGRVEYALNGGLVYTDSIDNAGGVNCSDKEVNIKILLDSIVRAGDLTTKQRKSLLIKMTNEVADLVLSDNFAQPRAINLAYSLSGSIIDLQARFMNELERRGKLDRELEFLPNAKIIKERKLIGKGLTLPSLSVLLSYSKITLKEQLLNSSILEDPFFINVLINSFPQLLQDRFYRQMQDHPLKREIIATKLSNIVVNEMGPTFVFRLYEEMGAVAPETVRAYMIARSLLDFEKISHEIALLGDKIQAKLHNELMLAYMRLLRRLSRWFLRRLHLLSDLCKTVNSFILDIQEFKKSIPDIFNEDNRTQYNKSFNQYIDLGIPKDLAHEISLIKPMFAALDIIEISHEINIPVPKVAEVYFDIGTFLEFGWMRMQIISHPTENHWEALSREALRDDLDYQQRQLTAALIMLSQQQDKNNYKFYLENWKQNNKTLIVRWQNVLSHLRSSTNLTYVMFFASIRELLDLTHSTVQAMQRIKDEKESSILKSGSLMDKAIITTNNGQKTSS